MHLLALLACVACACAAELTSGRFYNCESAGAVALADVFTLSYDHDNKSVAFDLRGRAVRSATVTVRLEISVYGQERFTYDFDPCEYDVDGICPIDGGDFAISGVVPVPDDIASAIPDLSFKIPNLDGFVKFLLLEDSAEVGCFEAEIANGKTTELQAVRYATVGLVVAALGLSGLSAMASPGGAGAPSPGFTDVLHWTQTMAVSGMMSVQYPAVYLAFTQNFGWSTMIADWAAMQQSIDSMRKRTGGDLERSSWQLSQSSSIVNYKSGALIVTNASVLMRRDFDLALDGSGANGGMKVVTSINGIARYVESLSVPSANSFMTVLLFLLIVFAAVILGVLLLKLVLELANTCTRLSKNLNSVRQRYWLFLGATIVRVIVILYGTFSLYCFYQFRIGDSWATVLLAGLTFGLFTVTIAAFAMRIIYLALKCKRQSALGIETLYAHKPWIRRYGQFYTQFRVTHWWFFVLDIVVSFSKSTFIAFADGHGIVQIAGQLALELAFMLALVVFRPFNSKLGNGVAISTSFVRALSLGCMIAFLQELGIKLETSTIVGFALIIIQSVLTVILAVLIVVNAAIAIFGKHRRVNEGPGYGKTLVPELQCVPELETDTFLEKGGEQTQSEEREKRLGGIQFDHAYRHSIVPWADDRSPASVDEIESLVQAGEDTKSVAEPVDMSRT